MHACVCVCVHVCTLMTVMTSVVACTCVRACVCVHVCACMCVCVYIDDSDDQCHGMKHMSPGRQIPAVLPCCVAGSPLLATAAWVLSTADGQTGHGGTRM